MKKLVLKFLLSSLSLNAQISTSDKIKEEKRFFNNYKESLKEGWIVGLPLLSLPLTMFIAVTAVTNTMTSELLAKAAEKLQELHLIPQNIEPEDRNGLLLLYTILGATVTSGFIGNIIGKCSAHKQTVNMFQEDINRYLNQNNNHSEKITKANTTWSLASALNEWGIQENLSPKDMFKRIQSDYKRLVFAITKLEVLKNEDAKNKNLYGLAISKAKEDLAKLGQAKEILYPKVYGTI